MNVLALHASHIFYKLVSPPRILLILEYVFTHEINSAFLFRHLEYIVEIFLDFRSRRFTRSPAYHYCAHRRWVISVRSAI